MRISLIFNNYINLNWLTYIKKGLEKDMSIQKRKRSENYSRKVKKS